MPIHLAAICGRLEIIEYLLACNGILFCFTFHNVSRLPRYILDLHFIMNYLLSKLLVFGFFKDLYFLKPNSSIPVSDSQ